MANSLPFWKTKTLEEMTLAEWESLCDQCGRCCVFKVREKPGSPLRWTDVGCPLLDCEKGCCSDYANRITRIADCFQMTPEIARNTDVLPPSCGYRRVKEGRDLAWWHPLISGNPDTVRQAGISVRGRIIPPDRATDLVWHIVDWPDHPGPGRDVPTIAERALFGGAIADVPTPFTAAHGIDSDRMATLCRDLLRDGCTGLVVFGPGGEGQSLGVSERLSGLEALVERGVPVSKVLPATAATAIPDTVVLTRAAEDLGCRGVLLSPPFYYKGVAADGLLAWYAEVIERSGGRIRVYLDHDPALTGVPLPVDVVEALFARYPDRVVGIRHAGDDPDEARAVCHRLAALGREVHAGSVDTLLPMLDAGGSGGMLAAAVLAPRLLAHACHPDTMPGTVAAQAAIRTLGGVLRGLPAVPALKAVLADRYRAADWRFVRPPHTMVGTEPGSAVSRALLTLARRH